MLFSNPFPLLILCHMYQSGESIECNEDVFVRVSKEEYPAKIVSNENPKFHVRFQGYRREVTSCDVSQVRSMVSVGKRGRMPTNLYLKESECDKKSIKRAKGGK